MTDDIVTRLRKQIPIPLEVADTGAPAYLIAEAADEIERLRTERDRWRELADSLARFGNCESPDCPDCDRDWKLTYESYEQAVRGE